MLRLFPILLILASTASAMVLSDSRVLSQSQMAELGVQVELAELPGPKETRKIWISAMVRPLGEGRKFLRLGFSILEKVLDADFASTDPRMGGIRDSKNWAKEIRGEASAKPFLRFCVSEGEISCGYIVVRFALPKDAGIPVFGTYYLPLTEIKREAKQMPEPTSGPPSGGRG